MLHDGVEEGRRKCLLPAIYALQLPSKLNPNGWTIAILCRCRYICDIGRA